MGLYHLNRSHRIRYSVVIDKLHAKAARPADKPASVLMGVGITCNWPRQALHFHLCRLYAMHALSWLEKHRIMHRHERTRQGLTGLNLNSPIALLSDR